MGCLGALFKKNSEFAPAYAPPTAEVKRDVCEPKQVPASVPKEVEHFEPCGCSDLSSAFARMSAGDADLPAYEEFSEFKDDAVSQVSYTHHCCELKTNEQVRETIRKTIDSYASKLTEISLYISDHPEESYEEHKACAKLTAFLKDEGFDVEMPYKKLDTAFRASYSHGSGRTFAFCSEYDALPGVGHACGHNLIAVSGVAALLGLRAAMKKHDIKGTVELLGTPAEEGGVGKGVLIERGAFKSIDASMMIHPTGLMGGRYGVGGIVPTLAICGLNVDFIGRAAHAGMAPWDGINALDAAHIAYASVSALRQQLHPDVRVHGIITKGGDRPNIVPAHTRMEYYVRAPAAASVKDLTAKLTTLFEAAGKATGCKVQTEVTPMMYELRNNGPLSNHYASVMKDAGHPVLVALDDFTGAGASTDFGNVTYTVPAAHPHFSIPATEGKANHTPEFTERCRSPKAHELTYEFAGGMAVTAARFLTDDEFAKEAKKCWEKDMERVGKP